MLGRSAAARGPGHAPGGWSGAVVDGEKAGGGIWVSTVYASDRKSVELSRSHS